MRQDGFCDEETCYFCYVNASGTSADESNLEFVGEKFSEGRWQLYFLSPPKLICYDAGHFCLSSLTDSLSFTTVTLSEGSISASLRQMEF